MKERWDQQQHMNAYWVANLMNATGNFAKHPVTAAKLLGSSSPEKERAKHVTPDRDAERHRRIEERRKRAAVIRGTSDRR